MWPAKRTKDFHQNMTFDPIRDETLGAASPKTTSVLVFTKIHLTRMWTNIWFWPYKRWNTEGSITQNYRCVDLSMMHICKKFERNPSRNVACRAHNKFPPKYDLWPYKRRNTRGSITQNNMRVDITKIHLHTKFERNLSRNAAVRAHTRMWTKIWPLTL